MKKQIIALSLGLMSVITFAQKKELRTAEKAIKKNDYATALNAVKSVEGMLTDMKSKYKSKYYFLKGQALAGKKNYEDAAKAFNNLFSYEKEIGKSRYTKDAQPMLNDLIQKVSNAAIKAYNDDKDYKEATKQFYLTYKLSPKDTSFLYNAAVSASLAKDYDTSLEYYKELKNVGYTGIATQYLATNKTSGEVENLGSKSNRDTMVKLGQYTNPTTKVSKSKKAEIVKNIGYIYVNQGKTEEAIAALQEARKSNPKDINLLLNEAQMYIKLKKMDKFGALMKEAVELDPTNPTLFFNLGVVNANENKVEEAIKYYKKAIELDPNYGDAYMNMAAAILSKEKAIVDEMNENLSNFKKYDELQEKQKELYRKALPFLEKADEIKRTEDTVRSLLNIYDTLEMTNKSEPLRKVYKEMRGQ
ncbi:tetratricopeptide repeat protein [Polaribacter cellanae]|uniref:Tetratricopeptide repeat protein n=1 Tax=Polaribacter cellanae TaxID=2818493 RepID=A0A975CNY7_9FLAO|nr:tetratricopeptide repeat protein [Polaribacter cellanae]QTE22819.1 tetratricopeptide repeat protein [Polaribacter cellanae]